MQIKINKNVMEELRSKLTGPPFNIATKDDRYKEVWHYNLLKLGLKELKKLQDVFAKGAGRGAKLLAKDVQQWIETIATKGPIAAKARTVRQMCGLVTELLRRSKRRHVYERIDETGNAVTLAYYATEVEYHEAKRRGEDYIPEYITLHGACYDFGVVKTYKWHLHAKDCLGKTPHEALTSIGVMLETPSLRIDYEFYLDTYNDLQGNIGRQCLAVGAANDEGIDGNPKEDNENWYWRPRENSLILDKDGTPTNVVVDVFRESEREDSRSDATVDLTFWDRHGRVTENDDGEQEWAGEDSDDPDDVDTDLTTDSTPVEIPVHPYVACFDLKRHLRLRIHAGNLETYVYDTTIRDKLVLPKRNANLIEVLLAPDTTQFKDVLAGKGGGTIILCQGPPGTGKTMTAEVYAEAMRRPLYTVQCAQLGVNVDVLEDNLMKVLARGRRWGAVMLLDEADVYVHARGSNLQQYAIVGVFLRVLEYHAGVLFLTTNRGDLVDDAILSRCVARIPYDVPSPDEQGRIWEVLAKANGITLSNTVLHTIVSRHPHLSGRDIKNFLKLAMMVSASQGKPITADMIDELADFKPTVTVDAGGRSHDT